MTCGDGLERSAKGSAKHCSLSSGSASRPGYNGNTTAVLAVVLFVASCVIVSCHAPGPEIILVPALPDETVPMLTAEPITVRVLIWNEDSEAFDISQRVTVPAGMTLHFVPLDKLLKEWR